MALAGSDVAKVWRNQPLETRYRTGVGVEQYDLSTKRPQHCKGHSPADSSPDDSFMTLQCQTSPSKLLPPNGRLFIGLCDLEDGMVEDCTRIVFSTYSVLSLSTVRHYPSKIPSCKFTHLHPINFIQYSQGPPPPRYQSHWGKQNFQMNKEKEPSASDTEAVSGIKLLSVRGGVTAKVIQPPTHRTLPQRNSSIILSSVPFWM